MPRGGRVVLGCAQQPDAEEEQHERHGIRDPAEGAGHDGVDHVADRALEGPPLAGGDDDRSADQGEPDPVAAVLGLEVARVLPTGARLPGDVCHAHPVPRTARSGSGSPPPLASCPRGGACWALLGWQGRCQGARPCAPPGGEERVGEDGRVAMVRRLREGHLGHHASHARPSVRGAERPSAGRRLR